MITRIEVKNYRSLFDVSQELKPFQILIGPNATGKSTFLDVVSFVGDIVRFGVKEGCNKRSKNFLDLTFNKKGGPIEFAFEFKTIGLFAYGIPPDLNFPDDAIFRYEIKIRQDKVNPPEIYWEKITLATPSGLKELMVRTESGNISFNPFPNEDGYPPSLRTNGDRTGLSFVPEGVSGFSDISWLIQFFGNQIVSIDLNGNVLKSAGNPGQGLKLLSSGENLPWIIEDLKTNQKERFELWLAHIKMALPDVSDILINTVPDLNQRYISILYASGTSIPSWMLSDGTLRFLALTIIAYLPDPSQIYLIEEPENGVHPKILEAVYQSLSSVYDAQIFVATHSPLLLGIAGKENLLLFNKAENGNTTIESGSDNPYLMEWNSEIDLGTIFASGILG